ncbi:MAG: hypothetical protein V8T31_10475 [Lachnospiraceae bacterium]
MGKTRSRCRRSQQHTGHLSDWTVYRNFGGSRSYYSPVLGCKRRTKGTDRVLENAIFLAIIGGILLMIAGQLLAAWALRALQTPESILAEALVYIEFICWRSCL